MDKEKLKSRVSEQTANFLLENIHYELFGVDNLRLAREHLQNGGSIIFYFNHFSKLDPALYAKIIINYLTPLDHCVALVSTRHLDSKRGLVNQVQATLFEEWGKLFGANIIPVIQEKDKKDYKQAEEFNRNAIKRAIKILHQGGNLLAVAPEGTRSKTNRLLPAEEGLELIFRLGGKNVLALPVAAVHGTIRPYNTKTKVRVGKPFSFKEVQSEQSDKPEESITNLMMERLAILLPDANRGYYLNPKQPKI
jgi:1-acyl-sn-glycerol-3-phosphate acyltransferase